MMKELNYSNVYIDEDKSTEGRRAVCYRGCPVNKVCVMDSTEIEKREYCKDFVNYDYPGPFCKNENWRD